MTGKNFTEKMNDSLGIKFIITGLMELIEKEGHTPREAFEVLEDIKNNTFHALMDLDRGGEKK